MEQKKERLEDWAENRKEHMKEMPWNKKLRWYLTYYGMQTAIIIVIAGFAIYLLWFSTIGRKETWLNGVVINADVEEETLDVLEKAFSESQNLNATKQLVAIDPSFLLNVEEGVITENNVTYLTKLEAYFAAKEIDLIIAPKTTCDYLDEREYYYQDMEEVMGTEFISRFDESQLRYAEYENGDSYICGVSLEGSKILTETDMMIDDPYIMIPYTSARIDHAAAFLKYIYNDD